eukprot:203156-Rhodomonas_salina.1
MPDTKTTNCAARPELFKANTTLARRTWELACKFGYECNSASFAEMQRLGKSESLAVPTCDAGDEETDRGKSPGIASAIFPQAVRPT